MKPQTIMRVASVPVILVAYLKFGHKGQMAVQDAIDQVIETLYGPEKKQEFKFATAE
jgi:hypothetical protein